MKYLCLAYGDEKDWSALSAAEKDSRLASDEIDEPGGRRTRSRFATADARRVFR